MFPFCENPKNKKDYSGKSKDHVSICNKQRITLNFGGANDVESFPIPFPGAAVESWEDKLLYSGKQKVKVSFLDKQKKPLESGSGESFNISLQDACSSNPCKNDGSCVVDDHVLYQCICKKTGWTGPNCDQKITYFDDLDNPPEFFDRLNTENRRLSNGSEYPIKPQVELKDYKMYDRGISEHETLIEGWLSLKRKLTSRSQLKYFVVRKHLDISYCEAAPKPGDANEDSCKTIERSNISRIVSSTDHNKNIINLVPRGSILDRTYTVYCESKAEHDAWVNMLNTWLWPGVDSKEVELPVYERDCILEQKWSPFGDYLMLQIRPYRQNIYTYKLLSNTDSDASFSKYSNIDNVGGVINVPRKVAAMWKSIIVEVRTPDKYEKGRYGVLKNRRYFSEVVSKQTTRAVKVLERPPRG
eukprot:807731_1